MASPPYTLVVTARLDETQRRWQAVLRHEPTSKLYRVCVGDLVADLRVEEISDNVAVLVDPAGRRHVYGDRFAALDGH